MQKNENQYRLLQSVLSVSKSLRQAALATELDKIDSLLKEQQRLLDLIKPDKQPMTSMIGNSGDKKQRDDKFLITISNIASNMKEFIDVLQKKKDERYKSICQALKQKSLSTYIREKV